MKNWTIRKRIISGFASVLLITLAIGLFANSRLSSIKVESDTLTQDSLPGTVYIGRIQANMRESYGLVEKHILASDPAAIAAIDDRIKAVTAQNGELYRSFETTVQTPDERRLFDATTAARAAYNQTLQEVLALSRANKDAEATALFLRSTDAAFHSYDTTLQAIVDYNVDDSHAAGLAIDRAIVSSRREILIGIGLALGIALVIGSVIVRSVNRRLRQSSDALLAGSEQVAAAAAQVSAASQSLAEGASEQAASLEETSASLEEVSSMTRRNAESADQAKAVSGEARHAADASAAEMAEMRRAMDGIKSSSDEIAKIIKTIDDIAFQTNILALNAAVEAARAGEAGMGFSVVAEEVRNLAQRAAGAAKETAAKIEVALDKSGHGVRISSKVAESLAEILEKARGVDAIVAEIATASREQSQGIEQVNSAVAQMDQITQVNAGSAEETAAAAEELSAQSIVMKETVDALLALVSGPKAGAAPAASPCAVWLRRIPASRAGRSCRAPEPLRRTEKRRR